MPTTHPDWSRWGIRYLDHLAITTPDLPRTLAAYLALPGSRLDRGPGHNPRQQVDFAFVRLGGCLRVELLSGDKNSPVAAHQARGGGPYHLCFAVENLDYALRTASEEQARVVVAPTPDPVFDGRRIAFVLHPLHGLLELVEDRPTQMAVDTPPVSVPPQVNTDSAGRLRALMHDIFPQLSPEEIPKAALDRTPGWDSLAHLQLMMTVEREFGIEIPASDMPRVTDYTGLDALLRRLTTP